MLPIFTRAEAFIAGLPVAVGENRRVLSVRSGNLWLLAEASYKLKREDGAVAAIEQAASINRRLYARTPGEPALVRKLAGSL